MKRVKRFLGIFLAILLAFNFTPAYAEEDPDSGECQHGTVISMYEGDYLVKYCAEPGCGIELSRDYVGCEHTYEVVYDIPATCMSDGYKLERCSKCDDERRETYTDRPDHQWVFDYKIDPTCTKGGYTNYYCSVCNEEKKDDFTDPLGHDYEEVDEEKDGFILHFKKCTRGDSTILLGSEEDHHTHIYKSRVTKEPTCTEDGEITYTCIAPDCDNSENATYTESIPALGHNFQWEVTEEPSCVENGERQQQCTRCSATGETEVIEATGHTYNPYALMSVLTPPNCYHTGIKVTNCSVCRAQIELEMPKTQHDFQVADTQPATCTEKGLITYVCDNCDDVRTEEIDKLPHDYEDVTVPSTCVEAGYTVKRCKNCNAETDRTALPLAEHSYASVSNTPATCTTASEEVYKCTVCNDVKTTHDTEALGHSMGEWTTTKEPSCTEEGIQVRKCTRAGCTYEESQPIDKVAHNYQWITTTEPTYVSTGIESHKCTVCGDVDDTRVVDKIDHEHEFGEVTVITPATCQSVGVGEKTCSICNQVVTVELPTVDHSYGEATVDRESTCVTNGQKSKKCIWCSLKLGSSIEELPLAEHQYAEEFTIDEAPTCAVEGSKSRHCMIDGCTAKTDVTSIDKVDHVLEVESVTNATCTEEGCTNYKCKNCTYTTSTPIEALGHNYVDTVVAPTCTEDGYTKHVCTRCNNEYTDEAVEKLGHTEAEPVTENVVDATCTEEGSYDEVVYCATCGDELSRTAKTIEKIAHIPGASVEENVIAPTCTENGSKDIVSYCTVCGTELSRDNETILAEGHVEGEPVETVTQQPTCTEAGSKKTTVSCVNCNAELSSNTTEIPALGHDETAEVTEPTCTEDGYTTYTCSRCHNVRTGDTVEKLGHDPAEAIQENCTATCTEAGTVVDVVKCNRCNTVISRETRDVEALGHDETAEITEPTCTEGGYTTYTCSRCNNVRTGDPVEALGHDETAEVTAPTCTTDGYTTYTCSRCHNVRTGDAVEKLGHSPKEAIHENEVPATCTAEGSYDLVTRCERCNVVIESVPKTIDKLAHTPGEAVRENEVAPTCIADGSYDEVVYCTACGGEISRTAKTVEALGHNPKAVAQENEVPATCTEDGHVDDVVRCERCNAVISSETRTLPATGHTEAEAVRERIINPDCTNAGSHDLVVYCATCGDELSRESKTVEALGHTYRDTVIAPTCTEEGYTLRKCVICGNEERVEPTEKVAHTPGEWIITTPATCVEAGEKVKKCTVCSTALEVDEVEIDPTAHKLITGKTNKVEPTCTEKGIRVDKCELCGEEVEVELLALGHKYDEGKVTKEPTYDEEGIKTITCTVCGDTKTESIAKLVKVEEEKSSDENSNDNDDNDDSKESESSSDVTPVTPAQTEEAKPAEQSQDAENGETPAEETPAGAEPAAAPMLPDMSAKVDVSNEELLEDVFTKTNEVIEAQVTNFQLSKDILNAAKENGNTLVLKSEGYSWTINGSDITDARDIDLGVVIGSDNINAEDIAEIANGNAYIPISLNYDGEFGFTATLAIDVDTTYEGKDAVLYYFNEGVFTEVGRTTVTGGAALFDFVHASDYVVVFEDTAVVTNDTTSDEEVKIIKADEEAPVAENKTKSHTVFAGIVIVLLICILVVPFVIAKRKKDEE